MNKAQGSYNQGFEVLDWSVSASMCQVTRPRLHVHQERVPALHAGLQKRWPCLSLRSSGVFVPSSWLETEGLVVRGPQRLKEISLAGSVNSFKGDIL